MPIKKKESRRRPTRRAFFQALAAAPALPALLTGAPDPAPQQAAAPAPLPVTAALAEVVRVRYGQQLADGQLDEIRQGLDRAARSSERLRAFKLKNDDEPDFSFHA